MAQTGALRAGTVMWVPCDVHTGMFPFERQVTIHVRGQSQETIAGYVPQEDTNCVNDQCFVRTVVFGPVNHKDIGLILRGDILSQSNPVVVPKKWLQEVGRKVI